MIKSAVIFILVLFYIFTQLVLVDRLYTALTRKRKFLLLFLIPFYLLFTGINLTVLMNAFTIYPFIFEEYESEYMAKKVALFGTLSYLFPLLFSAAGLTVFLRKPFLARNHKKNYKPQRNAEFNFFSSLRLSALSAVKHFLFPGEKKTAFGPVKNKKAFIVVKYLFFLLFVTYPLPAIIYGLSSAANLEINPVQIEIKNLDKNFEDFTIVHVSDIHYSHLTTGDYIKKVVNAVNSIDPDIVVLTGDYFIYKNDRIIHEFTRLLSGFNEKEKIFAIAGNHDVDIGEAGLKNIFNDLEIKLLLNENVRFYKGNSYVNIIGIDSYTYEKDNLDQAMEGCPENDFNILLAHNPDFIKTIGTREDIPLVLSGHTHGGQIRFPLVGQIMPASGSGLDYQMGIYNLNKITLFITRGVGTVTFPMRTLCNPEINILTLTGK